MRKRTDGFTLVELMVVVLVIGILVAVAVPVFKAAKVAAEKNTCQSFQRTWAGVVQQAKANEAEPTATTEAVKTLASGTGNSAWYGVAGTYLKSVPLCPTSKRPYWVYEAPAGTSRNGEVAGCDGEAEPTWADTEHPLASVGSGNVIVFNGLIYKVITAEDGRQWLDRNLGAREAATSSTDEASYGWLYQWGRGNDNHQYTAWGGQPNPAHSAPTQGATSASDTPGHDRFIVWWSAPADWRSPQNDNLWQGVEGINNPCPPGFRLPTKDEWANWGSRAGVTNAASAYSSALKLPVAGHRMQDTLWPGGQGSFGRYWSSSPVSTGAGRLKFDSSSWNVDSYARAYGASVRPIKN